MHETPPTHMDRRGPRIALRRADRQTLLAIAYEGLLSDTRGAGALLYEVSRADLIGDDAKVPQTATLWSRVLFLDDISGSHRMITLVPPEQAHGSSARVSVLSPVGAALVGLSKGQRISRPDRHGGELSLTVLTVLPPHQGPGGQT